MNNTKYQMQTVRGYILTECVGAMQKSIRRGDARMACYFAHEAFNSNFREYVWRRLLIICAEDMERITFEIISLRKAYEIVVKHNPKIKDVGILFVIKACITMSKAAKCRDSDNVLYDIMFCPEDYKEASDKMLKDIREEGEIPLPEYTFDKHSAKGRRAGKTVFDFFVDEQNFLNPKSQLSLFDKIPTKNFKKFKKSKNK